MEKREGFSLVELVIVILIISILAGIGAPIVGSRINQAKWAEANVTAGAIRRAVRAYIAEKRGAGVTDYTEIEGSLGYSPVSSPLGFTSTDLAGAFFNQQDYAISDVDGATGTCVVTVTSTHPKGPPGTGILAADGSWSAGTGGSGGGAEGTGGSSGGVAAANDDDGEEGDAGSDPHGSRRRSSGGPAGSGIPNPLDPTSRRPWE
jgi:prepilin-type N-terminal cleavage/methylation domain-containing protein